MKNMMTRAVFWLLFLLLVPSALAAVEISIDEVGKIISFYDQYYVYQINGTVTVTNPSNSSLYNIEIPYYISTLAVRTNHSNAVNYMNENQIFIYSLEAGSSERFHYQLLGISSQDLASNEDAVLANGIIASQPRIYSDLFGTLQKAQMENSTITGRDARVVSVKITNPTSFRYHIDKVEVIKTSGMDPNAQLDKWEFTSERSSLDPYEVWTYDVLDDDATEGEIYWLNTDIFVDDIEINSSQNISRFNQEDLFEIIPNATINLSGNDSVPFLQDRVYIRKFVSTSLVNPGDLVNVTLMVNNFEPRDIYIDVDDTVPNGFDVVSVRDGGSQSAGNISWENYQLSSGTIKRFQYSLRYMDEDGLGVDYFDPARLMYNGQAFYSQSIPFVRKYVPEHKVFVQKSVKFLSGDEVQVKLTVQNLGESKLENVMVKEHLLSSAEFREISEQPLERGLWRINELKEASTWETTYVTDRASVLNTVPEIFGVPQGSVLQTIILSNLISSSFSVIPTDIVEIVAIGVLVVILLMYFIPSSYFSRASKKQKRDLTLMSHEIESLRQHTQYQHQSLHDHQAQQSAQKGPVMATPEQAQRHMSHLSKERLARHQAVDSASAELKEMSKKILGKDDDEKKDDGKEKVEKKKD